MSSVWSALILLTCSNLLLAKFDSYRGKRSLQASPTSTGNRPGSVPENSLTLEVEVYNEDSLSSPIKNSKLKVVKKKPEADSSWSERLKRSTRDLTSNDQLRTVPPRSGDCGNVPCLNGGSCITLVTGGARGYKCLCSLSYVGSSCAERIQIKFPKFEAVGSYIVLKPSINTAYNFTIVLELKIQTTTGLLLYTNPNPRHQPSAFFSLTLINKQLEFRFGIQDTVAIMKTENRLEQHQWYRIKVERQGRRGSIFVDGKFWSASTESIQLTAVTTENTRNRLYLGGFPDHVKRDVQSMLISHAGNGAEVGLIGCVKKLIVNDKEMDLRREAFTGDIIQGAGIKDCSDHTVCTERKCKNGGRCKLTGPDTSQCLCPKNTMGPYCEKDMKLKMPKFTGTSFLKYTVLKRTSRSETNLEIVFKPMADTGLLLYSGYSRDKRGDFLAIFLRKGICEAHFDLGSGAARIRSKERIRMHEWHRIFFKRIGRLGYMKVDNQEMVEAFTPGLNVQLTLRQDFYLGNHENYDHVSYFMSMKRGFRGCVQKLAVNGKLIRLIDDAEQTVNVENCDHKCSQRVNPCSEQGECLPIMQYYNCSCALSFMGTHCEIKMERKDITVPEFFGQSYLQFNNSEIVKKISKPKMSLTMTVFLKQEKNKGVLLFLGSNMESYSRYILLKILNNYIEVFINDGAAEPVKMTKFGKILGNRDYRITLKRVSNYKKKKDQYSLLLDNTEVMTANQPREPKLLAYPQLLIGGVDKNTAVRLNLAGNSGITGCIKKIQLTTDEGTETLSVSNADDGRSIAQCSEKSRLYT